jgi:hypothetical protein
MLLDVSSKGHMPREGGCAVVRRGHLIALVGTLLIGCAVLLLVVGCAGVRSEASKNEQGLTEAAKDQEAHPERCEKTRIVHLDTYEVSEAPFITNDVPGCPKGGLLSGTNKPDHFVGKDGQDEIRGLGGSDEISGGLDGYIINGGPGNDTLIAKFGWDEVPPEGNPGVNNPDDLSKNVLHGGPGRDRVSGAEGGDVLYGGEGNDKAILGGPGKDILYGGPGNDTFYPDKGDELYCGEGKDSYETVGEKIAYVDSSCEVKKPAPEPIE